MRPETFILIPGRSTEQGTSVGFADLYTIEFENYPADPEYQARPERVAPVAAG